MSDKCDLCALKVTFDQGDLGSEAEVEMFFATLRELQKKKIIGRGYNRRTFAGDSGGDDKTEVCAVNSKYFLPKKKDKKCRNFILNTNVTVPEALSLNTAKSTDRLTCWIFGMTLVMVAVALIALFS